LKKLTKLFKNILSNIKVKNTQMSQSDLSKQEQKFKFGYNPDPTLYGNPIQNQLYNAIIAKMNTRTVDVEDTLRKSRVKTKEVSAPIGEEGTQVIYKEAQDEFKINQEIIDQLSQFLLQKNKKGSGNTEIEASFGFFEKGGFFPGVGSHTNFANLASFLHYQPNRNEYDSDTIVETMKDEKGDIRLIYDIESPKNKTFERKIRSKDTITIEKFGVRVSSSTEISEKNIPKLWRPVVRRFRRRKSFSGTSFNEDLFGFQIDLSVIQESKLRWEDRKEITENSIMKYELEIEVKSKKKTGEDFAKIILFIYRNLIANLSPLSTKDKVLFTMDERAYITTQFNNLFQEDIGERKKKWTNISKYRLYNYTFWNRPENIKLADLQSQISKDGKKYIFPLAHSYPTIKLNGKRMFLFVINNTCWLTMPPYTLSKFGNLLDKSFEGSLFDGEFEVQFDGKGNIKKYIYWIFDAIFYKNSDVRKALFPKRLEMIKTFSSSGSIAPFYGEAKLKVYYTQGDIYTRLRQAAQEYKNLIEEEPDSADGIVIQSSTVYFNNSTYKWKPEAQLTIDFKFWPVTKQDVKLDIFPELTEKNYHRAYFLVVMSGDPKKNKIQGKKSENEVFRPFNNIGFNGTIIFEENENYIKWLDAVVECNWDKDKKSFSPVKIRDDRSHPNYYSTAIGVWHDILDPIALSTLTGEDLVIMRKFHNKMKGTLLSKYLKPGDVIVDIGSGQGGDLNKWVKLGLEKVYAIEPSEDQRKEFISRLTKLQLEFGDDVPNISLLDYGAENTGKIVDELNGEKINAIVAFFSMTFFAQNEEIYKKFLDTANLVPKGGYFIGAVMDGEKVLNLLENERKRFSKSSEDIDTEIRVKNRKILELQGMTEDVEEGIYGINKQIRKLKEEVNDLENDKKIMENPNFIPLGENDAIDYKNSAFTIQQVTAFDRDNPFGNEIEITINDPTSRVKDQTEWLFFFENFQKKMSRMGFDLIWNSFLGGKIAEFLSKEAYTFSSLNRTFCFYRTPGSMNITLPEPDEIQHLGDNDYDNELVLVGVPTKYSSFIHSVLQCADVKYRELPTEEEKNNYVMKLRKRIAKNLTIEEFEEIHDGEYAKRMEYYQIKKMKISSSKAMEAAFLTFKIKLVDPNFNVADTSLLEILSESLDLSIFILNVNNSGISPYFYSSNKVYCNKILDHQACIIIGRNEGFYAIGRQDKEGVQYTFKDTDRVIKSLKTEICGDKPVLGKKNGGTIALAQPLIIEDVIIKPSYLKMAQEISGLEKEKTIEKLLEKFEGMIDKKEQWHTIKSKKSNRYDPLIPFINDLSDKKKLVYLDIGCGDAKDSKEISELIQAKQTYLADVVKQKPEVGKFLLIKENKPLNLEDDSVDVITMLHSLHHAKDLQFRLLDLVRILKPKGLLFIKDHNVTSIDVANAVSFEHFLYNVGEGKVTPTDTENFFNKEPLYNYSAKQIKDYLEQLGMKEVYFMQGKRKITGVYYAIFKKI
jgi:SAM-dependent methyltransferase